MGSIAMTFLQTVRTAGRRVAAAGVPEGGRHRLVPLLVLSAVALLAGSVSAAPARVANVLENIGFTALPGGEVQVVLTLAKPAPQPVGFSTERPARIALDLLHTRNALAKKTQSIGIGVARSITTAQADGRTRVVINLAKLVPYDVRVAGNRVYVTLNGAPAQGAAGVPVSSVAAGAAQPGITGVEFRRGAAGQALITVDLADSSMPWNLHEEGKKIYVDFMNANLPARLEQRLDVTDFATPVTHVDTYVRGNGARMAIAAHGQYEDMAYQAGDKLTIEIKPVTAAQKEARAKAKFKYTGQRLSLNFQNIQTRAVLQLIADFTGLNIVVSDSVKGNLTLRLKNVPWDQALAIILQTQGLGMRRSGNVIWVAPNDEIVAREKLENEARKQLQNSEPLRFESIQVNYAKA
ncbi:MAG TPA: type IV pilus secretin family protein, partial [Chromatiales bacterium]|nr:type IV pilus secretin family protein [Chromatiales bacterium]